MNIFCYRRTVTNNTLRAMLGVGSGLMPEFGFRPRIPLRDGKIDRTEIDMKLGDLLVEAKLTEGDFQAASIGLVERYRDFAEVFHPAELIRSGETFASYQLIRGVLAAYSTGRIVLRLVRRATSRHDRKVAFGHARGEELHSALSAPCADVAGVGN
jgi:hypothetical protein